MLAQNLSAEPRFMVAYLSFGENEAKFLSSCRRASDPPQRDDGSQATLDGENRQLSLSPYQYGARIRRELVERWELCVEALARYRWRE